MTPEELIAWHAHQLAFLPDTDSAVVQLHRDAMHCVERLRAEVKTLRRAHECANAEALRLAEELRKRDSSWGKPMILNDAAVEK